MDGNFVPWDDANVHVLTHSLHYGFGVFEGLRCYKTENGPAVFRLKEHVVRLIKSGKIIGLDIPYDANVICSAIKETVQINKMEECYIRPIAYIGDEVRGLVFRGAKIHMAIAVWPWGPYLGEEALEKGIRVKVSSFSRQNGNSSMPLAKVCGYYVNSIMAKLEAIDNGYDEALMLDPNGHVAEGSGMNIFMVRNGVLITPPTLYVLEGITRNAILKLAHDQKITVEERIFTRDELYISDEAFFCGTAAELTPIREIDGRTIGIGGMGPVTKKLQKLYFAAVQGTNKTYSDWLDFV